MTHKRVAGKPPKVIEVQIHDGYLHLGHEVARDNFASGALVVRQHDGFLDIFPVASAVNGGLIVKVRDSQGNRSVLIDEVIRGLNVSFEGRYRASWFGKLGCFRTHIGEVLADH